VGGDSGRLFVSSVPAPDGYLSTVITIAYAIVTDPPPSRPLPPNDEVVVGRVVGVTVNKDWSMWKVIKGAGTEGMEDWVGRGWRVETVKI
jgi:hypothetical protein